MRSNSNNAATGPIMGPPLTQTIPHMSWGRGMAESGRELYCELRWEKGGNVRKHVCIINTCTAKTLSELDRKISFLKMVMRLFWYWKVLQALLTHLFLPPVSIVQLQLSFQLFIALIKLCLWKYFSAHAIDNSLSSECEPPPPTMILSWPGLSDRFTTVPYIMSMERRYDVNNQ